MQGAGRRTGSRGCRHAERGRFTDRRMNLEGGYRTPASRRPQASRGAGMDSSDSCSCLVPRVDQEHAVELGTVGTDVRARRTIRDGRTCSKALRRSVHCGSSEDGRGMDRSLLPSPDEVPRMYPPRPPVVPRVVPPPVPMFRPVGRGVHGNGVARICGSSGPLWLLRVARPRSRGNGTIDANQVGWRRRARMSSYSSRISVSSAQRSRIFCHA